MTKQKSTKRALLLSALSLLMCVSMLIGSTFAWFTDSVTSAGNKIQSGTLKVDLEVLDKDGNWNSIKEDKTALFNYDKWEPGYTEFKVLKIENEGNLALKWYAKFVSQNDLSILADVIDVYVKPSEDTPLTYPVDRNLEGYIKAGTLREFVNTIETTTYGHLTAGDFAYLGIALKMQESAGNDYQGLELGAFDIMILATQDTVESDSFNNQYDANAEYPVLTDSWDGTVDTSWYNESQTVFTLTSAEQLAGMNQLIGEGVTFEGKTIQLGVNVDMAAAEWKVPVENFSGIFDGQGNTIFNLHRTVNEYEKGGRMGLFAHVEGGTVKNVTLDNADFYGYGPYGGVVCGSAYGECVFEDITLKNCNNEMYNTGSAGIVGLAYSDSNYTFNNINIDNSNVIGSYWGSWDTPCGGLIGYFWQNTDNVSPILVEDCYVACVMNVYNDVTANNQYYNYRRSGMLIGRVTPTVEVDGTTIPNPYMVTCNNVTVEYGEWANYRYCEWEEASSAWPHDGTTFQFYREDDNDFDSHVHTENEDNHNVLLTFDQLFGGHSDYVYGLAEFDGVTVVYNNK